MKTRETLANVQMFDKTQTKNSPVCNLNGTISWKLNCCRFWRKLNFLEIICGTFMIFSKVCVKIETFGQFSWQRKLFAIVSNLAKRYKALSFECLYLQPSRSINIVGKNDYIQKCSHLLAGSRGCVIFSSGRVWFTLPQKSTSNFDKIPPTHPRIVATLAAQGRLRQGISLGSLWLPISYTPSLFRSAPLHLVCY